MILASLKTCLHFLTPHHSAAHWLTADLERGESDVPPTGMITTTARAARQKYGFLGYYLRDLGPGNLYLIGEMGKSLVQSTQALGTED